MPKQLLVRSPKGGNKPTQLPFGTSIFDIRLELPLSPDIETREGLNVFALPAALIASSPAHFAAAPTEMRAALFSAITDASTVVNK